MRQEHRGEHAGGGDEVGHHRHGVGAAPQDRQIQQLCELISREVDLEDLNDAYDRLIKGEVKRSVVRYT